MALKEYKPGTLSPAAWAGPSASPSPAWPAPLRAKDGAPQCFVHGARRHRLRQRARRTAQGREKFSYRRATNSSTLRPDARMRARSVPGASSRC